MLRAAFAALVLTACAASPSRAEVISERADQVTLTVYHVGGPGNRDSGLTEVTETRTVDLPTGQSQIQFRGVAATMVPQTVNIAELPGIREQNFDFNLLSPGALLDKSIGESVRLVRTDKKTGRTTEEAGTLRSGPNGVVLQTAAGIETLKCDGQPERLIFDSIPADLFETPTLSVDAQAVRAGRYRITLRYLATGLTWAADYVARINPDGRTLTLSGWITLANASETGFGDTPVSVIAGAPNLTDEDTPPGIETVRQETGCWQTDIDWASHYQSESVRQRLAGMAGSLMGFAAPTPMSLETVEVSGSRINVGEPFNLGDYKLYALAEPTTVAAQQTKQVQFLNQRNVPFQKIYRVSGGIEDEAGAQDERPAVLLLRISNSKNSGLGKPLPAGQVHAYGTEDGATVLVGEKRIKDTPAGLPLDLGGNQTMAVSARAEILKSIRLVQGQYHLLRETIEVTAANRKNVPVHFEWCQPDSWDGQRLMSEDRKHLAKDGCWLWPLTLKPGEQQHFRYVAEISD